jgi:hypothetical protein
MRATLTEYGVPMAGVRDGMSIVGKFVTMEWRLALEDSFCDARPARASSPLEFHESLKIPAELMQLKMWKFPLGVELSSRAKYTKTLETLAHCGPRAIMHDR